MDNGIIFDAFLPYFNLKISTKFFSLFLSGHLVVKKINNQKVALCDVVQCVFFFIYYPNCTLQ